MAQPSVVTTHIQNPKQLHQIADGKTEVFIVSDDGKYLYESDNVLPPFGFGTCSHQVNAHQTANQWDNKKARWNIIKQSGNNDIYWIQSINRNAYLYNSKNNWAKTNSAGKSWSKGNQATWKINLSHIYGWFTIESLFGTKNTHLAVTNASSLSAYYIPKTLATDTECKIAKCQETVRLWKIVAVNSDHVEEHKQSHVVHNRLSAIQNDYTRNDVTRISTDINDGVAIISNALVVNISIVQYDGDKKSQYKAQDLKGVELDRQHMIDLFVHTYNYDMLCNKTKRCTRSDLNNIIRIAQTQFGDKENNYDCIIVIYSGHGLEHSIVCSDIERQWQSNGGMKYIYKQKALSEFKREFNGSNVEDKISAFKVFFVDACRGYNDANPIVMNTNNHNVSKMVPVNAKTFHPDANTAVFYPTTDGFKAYCEQNKGSVLLSALYETMMNLKGDESLNDIEDLMRLKTDNRNVDVLNDNGRITQHPVLIVPEYRGISSKQRGNIYFMRNDTSKSQRKFHRNNPNNFYKDINIEFK